MLVGYVRVSSSGQNPAMQIEQFLKEGCETENIFIEKRSGSSMEREEWQRCVNFLRKGDVLLIWSLDRMGRTTGAMIREFETLREKGVELKFLYGMMAGVDTRTDMGKLFYSICACFAEMERQGIRERCSAGIKSAKRKGVKFGRPAKEVDMVLFKSLFDSGKSRKEIRGVFERMGKPIGRNKFYECKNIIQRSSEKPESGNIRAGKDGDIKGEER
jgi:DNA invertase Pin-like site-specific DNA recombinase